MPQSYEKIRALRRKKNIEFDIGILTRVPEKYRLVDLETNQSYEYIIDTGHWEIVDDVNITHIGKRKR